MDNNNTIPDELREEIRLKALNKYSEQWRIPYIDGATEYAIWKQKYDELKAENVQLRENLIRSSDSWNTHKRAHEKGHAEHAALKERAQGLTDALRLIEQMSDPGSYEKAVYEMKSIASDALQSWNQVKGGEV